MLFVVYFDWFGWDIKANFRKSGDVTLEQATLSCPWVKTWLRSHTLACLRVWPWDLLIVIANAVLTGNWRRCHSNGYSLNLGMNLILGIRTIRPILHWSSLLSIHLSNINRVPLQRLWRGLMFLSSISGMPCFRQSRCCGKPLGVISKKKQYI